MNVRPLDDRVRRLVEACVLDQTPTYSAVESLWAEGCESRCICERFRMHGQPRTPVKFRGDSSSSVSVRPEATNCGNT